jgi:cytidylate kinase
MKSKPKIIAIDGPAASGKSTLALRLAHHLNYLYFDTGVLYRAVTWAALAHSVDMQDPEAITRLVKEIRLDVHPPSQDDGRPNDILVDGQDITWDIRSQEIEAYVSIVAAYPGVRQALLPTQRRVAFEAIAPSSAGDPSGVVMAGRDIGTVILPEADLKIFLVASAEERARRRWLELVARGEAADYTAILAAMRERDRLDSTREVAPLRPASDARVLSSDDLDADQVFDLVLSWTQEGE